MERIALSDLLERLGVVSVLVERVRAFGNMNSELDQISSLIGGTKLELFVFVYGVGLVTISLSYKVESNTIRFYKLHIILEHHYCHIPTFTYNKEMNYPIIPYGKTIYQSKLLI